MYPFVYQGIYRVDTRVHTRVCTRVCTWRFTRVYKVIIPVYRTRYQGVYPGIQGNYRYIVSETIMYTRVYKGITGISYQVSGCIPSTGTEYWIPGHILLFPHHIPWYTAVTNRVSAGNPTKMYPRITQQNTNRSVFEPRASPPLAMKTTPLPTTASFLSYKTIQQYRRTTRYTSNNTAYVPKKRHGYLLSASPRHRDPRINRNKNVWTHWTERALSFHTDHADHDVDNPTPPHPPLTYVGVR